MNIIKKNEKRYEFKSCRFWNNDKFKLTEKYQEGRKNIFN